MLLKYPPGWLKGSLPATSFGVRSSRIHRNECVTNEPQRTSARRLAPRVKLIMIHEEKQREGWMFTEWFSLNCSVCNIFLLLEQPSVLSTKQPFHRVTENLYIILSSYCSIILSYLYLAFVQLVSLIYLACVEDTLNRIAVVSPTSRVDSPTPVGKTTGYL